MPALTLDALARSKSTQRRAKNETGEEYVARLTHITVTGCSVSEMGEIARCKRATSVYLYQNALTRMEGLANLTSLTHLYLQHNRISRIEGLAKLRNLTKLFLGHNELVVVEGLQGLKCLRELHVEHQTLPLGEKLLFEPRSLAALSDSLCVLNANGNNLDDVRDLARCRALQQLHLAGNALTSIQDLTGLLSNNPELTSLSVDGNPLCNTAKFREEIVVLCASLTVLDGKEITETSRQFLTNLKDAQRRRAKTSVVKKKPAKEQEPDRLGVTVAPKFLSKLRALPPIISPRRTEKPKSS